MDEPISIRCCSCGQIVRRGGSEFCSEQCEQRGYRYCICGAILRPKSNDRAVVFRKRNYCDAKCRGLGAVGSIRCGSCGEFCSDEFCSDECKQRGYRYCACGCGTVMRPRLSDKPLEFRQRKYYDNECRSKAQALIGKAKWQDPVVRARIIRGLRISHNSDEFVQKLSKQMQTRWQSPRYLAAVERRRRLTPDQVREIRADPRPSTKIYSEYGVSMSTIVKVRSRILYPGVDRENCSPTLNSDPTRDDS